MENSENRLMSPWGYVGYGILYGIPVIGLILCIIHALDSSYLNRRNYARSFFCPIIIAVIAILIVLVTGGAASV